MLVRSFTAFFLLALSLSANACTSFVWYGPETALYGMNFDWLLDSSVIFNLSEGSNGSTVFTMSFSGMGPDPVATVGMNSLGVFSSMQVVNDDRGVREPGEGEAVIWMPFYYGLWEAGGYNDIIEFVKHVNLVQNSEVNIHLMVASPDGEAAIVEVGDRGNSVLDIEGEDRLVMTNFRNSSYAGVSPDSISGGGAGRYRLASAALDSIGGSLDENGALGVLQAALNHSENYPTRASMVFNPEEGEVLIALDGDMGTVWKLSMETGLIQGYRGLPEGLSYEIPEEGISGEDLLLRIEGF